MSLGIPCICLVGRPNVGKTSLYNLLVRNKGTNIAVDVEGTTRDEHYGLLRGESREDLETLAMIVDTGGFFVGEEAAKAEVFFDKKLPSMEEKKDYYYKLMADKIAKNVLKADLALLVVDGRDGLSPQDELIMNYLRKAGKEVWVVVNKCDHDGVIANASVFYRLGNRSGEMQFVSAAHGVGIADLKKSLKEFSESFKSKDRFSEHYCMNSVQGHVGRDILGTCAIMGTPNSGKSTLLNRLVGHDRALVGDLAGTTVDPVEDFLYLDLAAEMQNLGADLSEDEEEEEENSSLRPAKTSGYLRILDTAGIRRRKLVQTKVEEQSVWKGFSTLKGADIVLYVIDSTRGVTHQDKRLMERVMNEGSSLIVLFNKYDLVKEHFEGNVRQLKEWLLDRKFELPGPLYYDILTISSLMDKKLTKILRSIKKSIIMRRIQLPTGLVNKCVHDLVSHHSVPLKGPKYAKFKIKYCTQVNTNPPTLLAFTNSFYSPTDAFKRYVVRGLRDRFNVYGTPLHIIFRKESKEESRKGSSSK